MNYEIIKNQKWLENFLDWLPELEPNERFYVTLFARRKYSESVPNTRRSDLRKFVTTKERFLNKIKQLEIPLGSWKTKDDEPIDQMALALYINPNPRCMRKASFKTMQTILDKIQKPEIFNPKSVAMTSIHKSKSRSFVVDFDVDFDDYDKESNIDKIYKASQIIDNVERIVGKEAADFVMTKNGMHILIQPKKVVVGNNPN